MEYLVIGNPGSKRVEFFQKALVGLGLKPALVVPYLDLLENRLHLAQIVRPGTVVRIDSPDRDFEVEKALLRLGAQVTDEEGDNCYDQCSQSAVDQLTFDKGALLFPRQWYLGYRQLLRQLEVQLAACSPHQLMNSPQEIAQMFDKPACQALLAAANIPIPPGLGPIHSYAELVARMQQTGCQRVFIKLAHGSGAAGVVAYQMSGERHQATTTVEMVAGGRQLYNTRRLRVYQNQAEIGTLVDALCRHRVQVERWLPKASLLEKTFDLRVVVIAGQVQHVVVRLSRGTITNLHLSNDRAPLETVLPQFGPLVWQNARQTCERVMGCFPQSLYAGLDLLITSNYRSHAIIEVNAFGDLLYDTYHNGKDTYTAEIEAMTKRLAVGA